MKLGAIHSFLLLFTSAYCIPVLGADGQGGLGPQPQLVLGTNPCPSQYTLGTEPQPQCDPEIMFECGTIATCKAKGQTILALIESAITDTPGLTQKFENYYRNLLDIKRVGTVFNEPKRIKEILTDRGIPVAATITQISINGKTQGKVAYDQYYDTGIIVGNYNFRDEDPVTPVQNQVNWNVVAFEGYKAAGFNPNDLRYILRFEIINDGTKAVIVEVYQVAGKGADVIKYTTNWERWTLAEHGDSFLGLLGTPNGSGAGFILSDYAGTLNRRRITAILTRRHEGQWSMLIEYS